MQVFVKIYCELGSGHCLVCWMATMNYLAALSSGNWEETFPSNERFRKYGRNCCHVNHNIHSKGKLKHSREHCKPT